MADTFDTILKYALYVGLGLGSIFSVFFILILVEKPYRRRKRSVAEVDGQTPRDRERLVEVEDVPEQTAE